MNTAVLGVGAASISPSKVVPLVETMLTGVERILAGALKLVEKN